MQLIIEKMYLSDQTPPAERERCWELLLDADSCRPNVDDYLRRGVLYAARFAVPDFSVTPSKSAESTTTVPAAQTSRTVLPREIVGLYVALATRPRIVEIMNVAVTPDLQGQGLGKQLVQHALQTARAMKAKTVEIGTGNSGVGQLALYQKAGFRITGIDRDFFTRYYDEPLYENGIQVRDMIRLSQDL